MPPERPVEVQDEWEGYDDYDDGRERGCSHCGGEGICWDAADDISGACPSEPHNCHACGGSGLAKDQVIW